MTITEAQVLKALSTVEDPDFKKDLVTLKMIEDIEIDAQNISFTIVLTTPACPLKDKLKNDSINAIQQMVSADAQVEVNFTSRVTAGNINVNVLPNVKNIICVVSGKGGVGKSTISTNLALSLAQKGAKVGLIDADIHGPSIPMMLGSQGQRPDVREIKGKHYILPIEKHGIKFLSIGLLVDDRQAVVWRGAMISSALKQFITDAIWGKLDYLVIDMPPGTGDIPLTLTQTVPLTGAVIVTTPQDVATLDAKKAIGMFKLPDINVPVLGIVENMSYFTPTDMPDKKYFIFGEGGGQQLANDYELPLLAEIPITESIRRCADNGLAAVLNPNTESIVLQSFSDLAEKTAQQVAVRNAKFAELNTTVTA